MWLKYILTYSTTWSWMESHYINITKRGREIILHDSWSDTLDWKGQVNNLAVTSWRGPLYSREEAFSLINSSEQRRNVVIMYVSIEMRNQKFCFIRSFGLIAMVRHHISNNCHTSKYILLLLCLGFFPLRQFLSKRSHKLLYQRVSS